MKLAIISFFGTQEFLIILALVSAIAGALLFYVIRKAFNRLKISRRFRKGARGEEWAKEYLIKNGFTLREEEKTRFFWLLDNGHKKKFTIRADFLVEKNNRKALIEVKTGSVATDPAYTATRRQIFEYACYYGVDDIYLLNAETRSLHLISFPCSRLAPPEEAPAPGSSPGWFFIWVAGIILGALGAWLFFSLFRT